MRKLNLLVAAAAAFGLAPYALRMDSVNGALALLVLALGLAVAASGSFQALAIAAGAVGAFTGSVLASVSAAAGGAALVGLAYAERTTRVRGRTAQLAHVGAAILAGALGGTLAQSYTSAAPAVRVVAIVVAAVLAALPLLVDADDPLAHTLDTLASMVGEPARTSLREGAELRRNADDVLLDRDTSGGVRKTWASLLRLGEARQRLERARAIRSASTIPPGAAPPPASPADAVVAMVDGRIREHVEALSRAYTAVDAARAARLGLDDAALRSVTSAGESLEQMSRALIYVSGDVSSDLPGGEHGGGPGDVNGHVSAEQKS